MGKPQFVYRFFAVVVFMLCLGLYSTCKSPGNDTTQSDTETQLELNNLEQFKVILYSDSSRHSIFAEIAANDKITVSAVPNNSGVTYYPTYYIDVPEIPDTNIPYNGQAIVTVIEANKINKVFIPKLENIAINTAYLKIINDSIYSLSLQQGGNEKAPLGGRPSIIASGQNAAYEINPGASSIYSVMRNTTTPVDFPVSFAEFEKGKVYIFTYSGTGLVRTATWPVPSPVWPTAPKNVQAEVLSSASVRLTWDAVYDAASYRVYRAVGSETALYTRIADAYTLSCTNTGLSSNQMYFYKVAAIKDSKEGDLSEVVSARTTPAPEILRVVGQGDTFVLLAWSNVSGASSYNIYRSETQNGNYLKVSIGGGLASSDYRFTYNSSLEPLTTYYYRISANVAGTEGTQSIAFSATTRSPIDFRVTDTTATSISLAWNTVGGATGYVIERSNSEDGTFTRIANNLSGNSYANSGISSNTTYYYKIGYIFSIQSNHTHTLLDRIVSATTEEE